MSKIGRNDPCPCGSGKKHKKCCLGKDAAKATPPVQISVSQEVEKLQEAAGAKQETIKSVGVFNFITTADGDGWLLELSDKDALQVAKAGEKLNVEISENPETIEVNWSHRFEIKDKKFTTTSYADNTIEVHQNFPHAAVKSAIQRINRNFSNQLLDSIHVS
jgi:hypothetical protein